MSRDDIFPLRPAIIHEVVWHVMSTKHFSTDDFGTERWTELQQYTLVTQADAVGKLRDRQFSSKRSVLDSIIYARLFLEGEGEGKGGGERVFRWATLEKPTNSGLRRREENARRPRHRLPGT